MSAKITPLYVICSPRRSVGKTLLSRLFIEFSALIGRSVAAFDLADEGPQLRDYLPQFTAIADIDNISGQMSFFERLVEDNKSTRIIDVSYRSFQAFFDILQKVDFFDEARKKSIEPLILFIIDTDPRSCTAYASLRRRFTHASLVPVLNRVDATPSMNSDPIFDASGTPAFLQIPLLSFALRAQIDRPEFSFCEFWRRTRTSHTELRHWVENMFSQIQDLEHIRGGVRALAIVQQNAQEMGGEYLPVQEKSPPQYVSREVVVASSQRQDRFPYEVRKFASGVIRRENVSIDQCGESIISMLQSTSKQLQADKDRLNELELYIEHIRERARNWLQLIANEITEKR